MIKKTILSLMLLSGVAVAQDSDTMPAPAELPPPIYGADQYIDSTGCAFLRVILGDEVIWAPRFRPDGIQACGMAPSLSSPPAQTETALAPAEPTPASPKPKPEEVAEPELLAPAQDAQPGAPTRPPLDASTAGVSVEPEAPEPQPPFTTAEPVTEPVEESPTEPLTEPDLAEESPIEPTPDISTARGTTGFEEPGFYVQAGAFGVPSNAARVAGLFTAEGWGVETRSAGRLTVVYAGPFGTEAEAQTALAQIRRQGMPDALIRVQN